MPLIIWGALALGGALGIGGTIATTSVAVDVGNAVNKSTNSLSKLITTGMIAGAGYMYAKHKKWI